MKAPDRSPSARTARFEALLIASARDDAAPEASRRRVAERLALGALGVGAERAGDFARDDAPRDDQSHHDVARSDAAPNDAAREDAAPRRSPSEALSLSKPAALCGLGGIGAAGVLLWALAGPSRALDAPAPPLAPTPRESADEVTAHTPAPALAGEARARAEHDDEDATNARVAAAANEPRPAASRPVAARRSAEAAPSRSKKPRRTAPSKASTATSALGATARDGDLLEEVRALDRARHELSQRRASAALAVLDDYARRFPRGQLTREALALRSKVTSRSVVSGSSTERKPALDTSNASR